MNHVRSIFLFQAHNLHLKRFYFFCNKLVLHKHYIELEYYKEILMQVFFLNYTYTAFVDSYPEVPALNKCLEQSMQHLFEQSNPIISERNQALQ